MLEHRPAIGTADDVTQPGVDPLEVGWGWDLLNRPFSMHLTNLPNLPNLFFESSRQGRKAGYEY